MNNNLFFMNGITLVKKATPVMVVFLLVLGVFNTGTYNQTTTSNLAVVSPNQAQAFFFHNFQDQLLPDLISPGLTVPDLTVPDLTVPDLTVPDLTVPNLTVPDLGQAVVRTCNIQANVTTVNFGSDLTIFWQTQGFSNLTINGQTVSGPNGSRVFTNIQANTTYTLTARDGNNECTASVTVVCLPVPPPTCILNPNSTTITSGQSVNLSWTTTNAQSATLTGVGNVPVNGSRNTGPLATSQLYTLTVLGTNGTSVVCHSSISVNNVPPPVPAPTCVLNPANSTITSGQSVNLSWTTTNAQSATLTGVGNVPLNSSRNTGALTSSQSYTLTVLGTNGSTVSCTAVVTVVPVVVPPPTCILNPTNTSINAGQSVNLTWSTTNAQSVTLTGFGNVEANNGRNTGALTSSQSYTLTVLGTNGSTVSCQAVVTVNNVPPVLDPICESFNASPVSIVRGSSANLNWMTRNATRVVIDNAIGEVSASGTLSVTPLATTEYTLKVYGQANKEVTCKATVTVTTPPVVPLPDCISFTATPATLPAGGGTTVLAWQTKDATSVNITPTIGSVAGNGTTSVTISTTTTYNLVAAKAGVSSDSCAVTIVVAPVVAVPITCQANVTFTANPSSINRGNSSSLSWTTNGITSLSFNQGITATGLSGSVSVSPNETTTYTMTASDGKTTISCPVQVSVSGGGGGGGGGSVSPSCQLSISKTTINRGEEITLRWDTSRATNIEIIDSFNKVIVTTKNLLSKDKSDLFDGSIKVAPTRDTRYRLIAERGGSRDDECIVSVSVRDNVVVSQVRNQLPLIAGISLSEVPYTGFEAGPILTVTFYLLLALWALYIAYLIVIRRDVVGGYNLPEPHLVAGPEAVRPDVFVASVKAPEVPPSVTMPVNLPVGNPVIGYANVGGQTVGISANLQAGDDRTVTEIENHAHKRKVLLSSDAIRHFVGTTKTETERIDALDEVITLAKSKFPSEDGWIVINENRMRDLCVTCSVNQLKSSDAPFVPTVIPEGSGSLAEAIVTGNIIAAYEMIGHRPMFALADASADLDAVYRLRKGAQVNVSDLLVAESAKLTDEQIMKMIEALTSALDGVYTDEASAVKMAIMKAVKVVA